MKNIEIFKKGGSYLFATLAAVFLAFLVITLATCADVKISDYDWSDIQVSRDPTRNSGFTEVDLPEVVGWTELNDGVTTSVITGFEFSIVLDPRSDVLKKSEITKADLDFITFHDIIKAPDSAFATADTLSAAPIDFVVENNRIQGNVIPATITKSINTGNAFSNIVFRVDGKKYTYDNGTRLDIDQNGKIEDIYDDEHVQELDVGLGSSAIKASNYTGQGQKDDDFSKLTLAALTPPDHYDTQADATADGVGLGDFYFAGDVKTTNRTDYFLQPVAVGLAVSNSNNVKDRYKDFAGKLAEGIKLQKLSSGANSWEDVKTAVYDDKIRGGNGDNYAELTTGTGNTYIVFRDIQFEHFATYRVIWTGSAYTETTNTYYGVKQRLYIDDAGDPPTGALRYTRTEVVGEPATVINENIYGWVSNVIANYFGAGVNQPDPSRFSHDAEGRKNIIKVELGKDINGNQYFWNTITDPEKFRESFKVVYAADDEPADNTNPSLVEVAITKVEYVDEYSALHPAANPTGVNVVYLTLDPDFSLIFNKSVTSTVNKVDDEGEDVLDVEGKNVTEEVTTVITKNRSLYFRINNGISYTNKLTNTDAETLYFGGPDNNGAFHNWFQFYGPFDF